MSYLYSIPHAIQEVLLSAVPHCHCNVPTEFREQPGTKHRLFGSPIIISPLSRQTSTWNHASSHLMIVAFLRPYRRSYAKPLKVRSLARSVIKPNQTKHRSQNLISFKSRACWLAPIPKNSSSHLRRYFSTASPLMRRRDCHEYVTEWQVRRASDLHQEAIPILFLALGLFWFELGVPGLFLQRVERPHRIIVCPSEEKKRTEKQGLLRAGCVLVF